MNTKKYIVIYTNNNKKVAIDNTSSLNEYVTKLKIKYADVNILFNCKFDDIKNRGYVAGKYMLINENKITLIEKIKNIDKGYIYNTSKYTLNTICEWEIIETQIEEQQYSESNDSLDEQSPNVKFDNLCDCLILYDKDDDLSTKINIDGKIIKVQNKTLHDVDLINKNILIIAKRGSGKTNTILNMLEKIKKTNPIYSDNLFIVADGYSNYTTYESICTPKNKLVHKIDKLNYDEIFNTTPGIVIFDECLHSKTDWMKNENITNLFFNAKHYNKIFIVSLQYPLSMLRELKINFDHVLLFADDFHSNQKRLYDQYCGMFSNFNLFKQVFTELTTNKGCMILDNANTSHNFLDKFAKLNVPKYETNNTTQTTNFIPNQKFIWSHQNKNESVN